MEFGLHPLILIAAVTLIGAVACLVFAYLTSKWIKRGILIVAALFLLCPSGVALIGFKPELVDDRFKTYKQLFGDIEVGMSRADVMTLIDQHYPSEGGRIRPNLIEDSEKKAQLLHEPRGLNRTKL